MRGILLSIAVVGLFCSYGQVVRAEVQKAFIFDNYSLGSFDGVDGWETDPECDIFAAPYGRSGKAAGCDEANNLAVNEMHNVSTSSLFSSVQYVRGFFSSSFFGETRGSAQFLEFDYNDDANELWALSYDDNNFDLEFDVVGINDLSLFTLEDDTWYYFVVEIDYPNEALRVTVQGGGNATTSAWIYPDEFNDPVKYLNLRFKTGSGTLTNDYIYLDDIYIETDYDVGTPQDLGECSDCTRVIATDPTAGEILASTTNGYNVQAQYWVNEDDFCGITCTTYVEFSLKHWSSQTINSFNQEVPDHSYPFTLSHFFDSVNATGTYALQTTIYNRFEVPFFTSALGLNRVVLYNEAINFHVDSATSQGDIDAYRALVDAGLIDTTDVYDAGSADPGSLVSPGVFTQMLRDTFIEFSLLPPWGYAVLFNQTLQNGTSTTLGTIPISFPTSSPAHGLTLDLNIDTAFASAIATIRAEPISTEHGDMFDTFMYWWTLLWYMALAIWTMKQVLGFDMNFSGGGGSTMSKSDRQSKTLDMRGQRSSTINMKNS